MFIWRWRNRRQRLSLTIQLLARYFGLDDNARTFECDAPDLAGTQSLVAASGIIVALSVGKGILLPGQDPNPLLNRLRQDVRVAQAWEVEILRKIFGQLLDADMLAAPER